MNSFLYFIPVGSEVTVEKELAYAYDDNYHVGDVTGAGPGDGKPGKIICDSKSTAKIGYYPGKQIWRRIPKLEAYVGFYSDFRPTANDLVRTNQIPGREYNGFLIPLARQWKSENDSSIRLPSYVDINDEGELVFGNVVERCKAAYKLSQELYDTGGEMTQEYAAQAAIKILGFNYRVSAIECGMLEFLTIDDCQNIIALFEEWDKLAELQKKTRQDTPDSTNGD